MDTVASRPLAEVMASHAGTSCPSACQPLWSPIGRVVVGKVLGKAAHQDRLETASVL